MKEKNNYKNNRELFWELDNTITGIIGNYFGN